MLMNVVAPQIWDVGLSKSCGTMFDRKHASSLDGLLCQIWSLEFKRCGRWERWIKR